MKRKLKAELKMWIERYLQAQETITGLQRELHRATLALNREKRIVDALVERK